MLSKRFCGAFVVRTRCRGPGTLCGLLKRLNTLGPEPACAFWASVASFLGFRTYYVALGVGFVGFRVEAGTSLKGLRSPTGLQDILVWVCAAEFRKFKVCLDHTVVHSLFGSGFAEEVYIRIEEPPPTEDEV